MNIIKVLVILSVFVAGSVAASARGQVPPPPPFVGGNIGGWMGDGGSGPLFGFDDPWGKDMPFGTGGAGTPGFTGWLSGGGWIRGSSAGNPFGSGGGPGGGGPGGGGPGGGTGGGRDYGCPGPCQSPSLTGGCRPLCYCRPYYMGQPGDLTCDMKRGADWNGRMCYVLRGGCPDK